MAYKKKEDKKDPGIEEKIKSDLSAVKKLETYAKKNKKSDAYGAVTSYIHASQILYNLADATQDKKYANMADDYKTKAENLSDNAVKQLDDKGNILDATKLLAMLGNTKKADAYAKKLEKRGDYGKAGTTYLVARNPKKAKEMVHYALEKNQTLGAASIINQIADIEIQESGLAAKYEERGARKLMKQMQGQQGQDEEEQEAN